MEISPLIGSVSSGFGAKEPELGYAEDSKGLKAASKDFVSILFSYMFSTMRGNPDENSGDEEGGGGSLFSGENVNMFMGFLDQEVGKKFSEQGGKDTVDALYRQLKGDKVFKDEQAEGKNISQKDLLSGNNIPQITQVGLNSKNDNRIETKEGNNITPSKKVENVI